MTLNKHSEPKDEEEEEGFMALFGGLSFAKISSMLMSPEVVAKETTYGSNYGEKKNKGVDRKNSPVVHKTYNNTNEKGISSNSATSKRIIIGATKGGLNNASVYQRAFQQSSVDGKLMKPSVELVDMSHEMKGKIMVASRSFSKGEIIFSERALEGVQMPRGICIKCKLFSCLSKGNPDRGTNKNHHQLYKVRGCQQCFKSLEPASCLFHPNKVQLHSYHDQGENENETLLPLSHLWPIPEYDKVVNSNDDATTTCESGSSDNHLKTFEGSGKLVMDSAGRVTCKRCSSIFCNRYCAKNHMDAVGDCCKVVDSIIEIIHSVYCCESRSNSADDKDDDNHPNEDGYLDIDPVLLLATRMFCVIANRTRNKKVQEFANPFECLCGEAEDITPLRLGLLDSESGKYTLERAYDVIASLLQLSTEERDNCLSLKEFHKTAAIAQRNAISLMTGSPFQTYYQSLIREAGGRGSARQKELSRSIAYLLGSRDGTLTRNMDRLVEEKCVIKMGGIFTLASMINHACDPCAEIRGCEYVDCNIDVVAKRNIKEGEEITISYLGVQQNSASAISRSRRQRDLESKYLFTCTCSSCKIKLIT